MKNKVCPDRRPSIALRPSRRVYLVGAGPGDPALITVRGRRVLRQADVVIHDYLVDPRMLAEARPDAELVSCGVLGKCPSSGAGSLKHQEKINALMILKARQGMRVVRLKCGDPFIFGRASEEMRALIRDKIGFEIIPGVTAASVAASFSGIPLTDRRCVSSCVFVTGHENPARGKSFIDWQAVAGAGTAVFYMAVKTLPAIIARLAGAGKSRHTPAAVVQDAGLLTQKVVTGTLKDIVAKTRVARIRPPAVIIIGEVVRCEKEFNWFREAKKVLFTGISQERFFEDELVFHLPLIRIAPLTDYREFDRALKSAAGSDWLVFSSRYGAQYFFQRLNHIGLDARRFGGVKIAAIGDSTRRKLLEFGMVADLVPEDESSRGLLEAFGKMNLAGKKIFVPRSDLSDKGLTDGLAQQGAVVCAPVAYRNIAPEVLPDIDFGLFDEIRFSSPSGVRNFIARYGSRIPKRIKVSCIGDVTRNEARKWDLCD